jgi:7-carboxy-7-deazaguanine synthase
MIQYMNLTVCEIFKSILGESSFAGLPFTIVRLTGCNLRCSYCDTSYAWTEGTSTTTYGVTEIVRNFGVKNVLLTGGEPLLQAGSTELLNLLVDDGNLVLVETNGSIDISVLPHGVIAILDIKSPGSHQRHMMDPHNLERLRPEDEVKFVLTDRSDYEWAREICLEQFTGSHRKILMAPAYGKLSPKHLARWILSDNLEVRLQLQLHKQIWPDSVRGV